jgi:hypothetical protein
MVKSCWQHARYYILKDWGSIPGRARKDSFIRYRDETSSGAHPASYRMGTAGIFSGSKVARVWSWPSSAEVKSAWSCSTTNKYVITAWCLIRHEIRVSIVVRHRENFILLYFSEYRPVAKRRPERPLKRQLDDTIVRPKQVIHWPNLVTRRRKWRQAFSVATWRYELDTRRGLRTNPNFFGISTRLTAKWMNLRSLPSLTVCL